MTSQHRVDACLGATLIVVAWCAAQALAGEPQLDTGLAAPVYAVEAPVASTVAAPLPSGGRIATSNSTTPQPLNVPATVDVPPLRGVAVQVTPTVPPPVTYTIPHYDEWVRLAECESGGDWSINTGNGYYGGLQFSLTSWRGAGGQQYATYPHQAGAAEQMLTAERLYELQGWAAWPSCSRQVGLR